MRMMQELLIQESPTPGERDREREIQPYVHSASVAYEDKSLFMSQPVEG